MVETIVPVVHGGRRTRYWQSVGLHVLGAVSAAAAFGALLGALGALLSAPWGEAGLLALAAVAALYGLREGAGLPIPIPDRHRQVPDWWRTFFSPRTASLLYGLGLGVGFLTFLSFGTFVAVAAGAIVSGDPLLGAALCAPFGLARSLSVTLASRTTSAEAAAALVDHLGGLAVTPIPRTINAIVLAAVAAVALLAL